MRGDIGRGECGAARRRRVIRASAASIAWAAAACSRVQPIGLVRALRPRPRSSRAASASARGLLGARRLQRRVERQRAGLSARALAASSSGQSRSARARAAHRSTFAMIGVVRKDRCRPEQLLGEHRPDEQVRPGRGPERQQQVGASALVPRRGRRRRRSGSAPRACRRRASLRASSPARSRTAPCPARRGRRSRCWPAASGTLPPRSGSSVTLVGQAMRFR